MVKRNFGGRTVQLVTSYRRLDELTEKLEKFSYRVLKEDCLDLPEKVFVTRNVELSDDQKKMYLTEQRQNNRSCDSHSERLVFERSGIWNHSRLLHGYASAAGIEKSLI